MNFKQSFILALKSLSASKMRSFLTMLGIIIGVASVIILVSVVNGMKQSMVDIFEDMGTNLITVSIRGRGSSRAVTPQDMIDFAEEKKEIIAGCSPNVTTSATAKVNNENITTNVLGVSEAYKDIKSLEISQGRFLEYIDVERKQKVCVVGTYIVKELYGGVSPVGNTIKIGNEVYRVIGVLEEVAESKEASEDDKIIIPYTSAARMAYTSSYLYSASDEDNIDRAVKAIENFLYKIFSNTDAFRVTAMDEIIDTVDDLTGKMTMMLVGIAGISLLVGGIGIMNIMLVSVTERTREIGIRKSLGAMQRDIMSQFVVEAATSSAIGGIIGIVLGIVAAIGMGKLINIAVFPSVSAVIIAFSVSAIIGITFGYFPAKKAARLNPIDALRYD